MYYNAIRLIVHLFSLSIRRQNKRRVAVRNPDLCWVANIA